MTEEELAKGYGLQALQLTRDGNYKEAKSFCHRAISIYKKTGDIKISSIYTQLGLISYHEADFDKAKDWYSKSLDIDTSSGDDMGKAKTLHNLAAAYNKSGDHKDAVELLQQSISIKEEHCDHLGTARSYLLLGNVANAIDDFEKAEQWYLRSIELYKLVDEVGSAIDVNLNLYWNALNSENEESITHWFEESLVAIEDHGDINKAIQFGTETQDAEIFTEAEQYFELALRMAKNAKNLSHEAFVGEYLGYFHYQQHMFDLAIKWYEKSYELFKAQGKNRDAARCCKSIGNVFLARLSDSRSDIQSSKSWYRKSLKLDESSSIIDWLKLSLTLWKHRIIRLKIEPINRLLFRRPAE